MITRLQATLKKLKKHITCSANLNSKEWNLYMVLKQEI